MFTETIDHSGVHCRRDFYELIREDQRPWHGSSVEAKQNKNKRVPKNCIYFNRLHHVAVDNVPGKWKIDQPENYDDKKPSQAP